jgi:hypothetical protein
MNIIHKIVSWSQQLTACDLACCKLSPDNLSCFLLSEMFLSQGPGDREALPGLAGGIGAQDSRHEDSR